MREPQHEPVVEIGKAQRVAKLYYSGWGWPILNNLYLGWIHMHALLINDVPQILNLGHAKSAFLHISTQLVLSQGLEDLSNMVEVVFPNLAENKDVI